MMRRQSHEQRPSSPSSLAMTDARLTFLRERAEAKMKSESKIARRAFRGRVWCAVGAHAYGVAKRLETIDVYTVWWPDGDRSTNPTHTVYVYEQTCTRCHKHRVRKNRIRA